MTHKFSILKLFMVISLVCAVPSIAQAQTKKDIAKASFEKGQMLYQQGKYLQAIKAMKEAYQAIPKPVILFYIAEIYKDAELKEEAVTYYRKYLEEARINDPTGLRKKAEDALKKLGASAKADPTVVVPVVKDPDKKPDKTPDKTPDKKPVKRTRKYKKGELIHTPLEEAQPNHPAKLEVELPEDIKRAWLYIYYRKPGQDKYQKVKMKVDSNDIYFFILPCSALSGSILQYYIEAIGVSGKKIAGSGTESSPFIVDINKKNPLQPGGKMACSEVEAGVKDPGASGNENKTPGISNIGKTEHGKTRPKSFYFAIGTTGVAAALIGASIAFGFLAQNQATLLSDSQMNYKPDGKTTQSYPPTSRYSGGIVPFSGSIADYDSKGKMYQNTMFIAAGFATLAAAAAVYFWLDSLEIIPSSLSFDVITGGKPARSSFLITPMFGDSTVGIGTSFNF
ncbi:tetratricopeptide repeat protein [Myxococcota bacterium]|nr:tetratricopeptide repeat protein [Myxococcota bacterium]MBU1381474.1 tetratricopeptide repeat protein [Myxococcota bacterium]MBU1497692.1 tetratricopeptide repeat protein [Myxococcota bacterium]